MSNSCPVQKCFFSKFCCGFAPLRIETIGYEGILCENSLCFNDTCRSNNNIEDEKPKYFHSNLKEVYFRFPDSTIFLQRCKR